MYLFIYLFTKKMFVIILAKQSYFSFETKKQKVIFEKKPAEIIFENQHFKTYHRNNKRPFTLLFIRRDKYTKNKKKINQFEWNKKKTNK